MEKRLVFILAETRRQLCFCKLCEALVDKNVSLPTKSDRISSKFDYKVDNGIVLYACSMVQTQKVASVRLGAVVYSLALISPYRFITAL